MRDELQLTLEDLMRSDVIEREDALAVFDEGGFSKGGRSFVQFWNSLVDLKSMYNSGLVKVRGNKVIYPAWIEDRVERRRRM